MNRWIAVWLIISAMWLGSLVDTAKAQTIPDDQTFNGNIQSDARDNGMIDARNENAHATGDSVAVNGSNNVVVNDSSQIGEVVFAVADAVLEQVNMVGTTGANVDLHDLHGQDIHDIHYQNNVGVSGANVASGNFNNQAHQNVFSTATSRPGFLDSTRALGVTTR